MYIRGIFTVRNHIRRRLCNKVSCNNNIIAAISNNNHHYPTQHPVRNLSSGSEENSNGKKDEDRSKFTHEVKVSMPEVGEGEQALGVIQKWYKQEGDVIKRDEVICDIRTELFTFGMLTDDDYDSIMGEILIPEESDPVMPGTVICITLNEEHGNEDDDEEGEK